MSQVLQADGMRKRYGQRDAVAGVSLHVGAGQILGLLGPNGAGKSTLISMICGLTTPDAGRVSVGGTLLSQDAAACKRRIGLVPQELALFDDLSARDNIQLFGALYGLAATTLKQRGEAVLKSVGLADRAGDKPAQFSGGMKRRLHIACALMHDPDLLLLDEPTAGVDPQSRNAIFETLLSLKAAGKAIVYTTHYMEEVERLADRIVIVDHGRVVAEGTLGELVHRLPAAQKLVLDLEGEIDAALLTAVPGVRSVEPLGGRWVLGMEGLASTGAAVLQALAARGVAVRHVASGRANLEDVFLSLTGRQLRD
jgi:ABC-2 type transport system ATP-binding protein